MMSCVRENSPPLELDLSASGPLSLPDSPKGKSHGYQRHPATSTPIASPQQAATTTTTKVDGNNSSTNVEQQQQQQQQQKRRRFHPLRNLRRIFRRRTINSADSAASATGAESQGAGSCNTLPPPASSSSEKNLRSIAIAGVSSSSSTTEAISASSPASPLTHQQLHESYQTQSLPKSKSYGAHRDELLSVLLGKKRASKQTHCLEQLQQTTNPQTIHSTDTMYQTQRQQMGGVPVFPDTMGMHRNSYYAEMRLHHRQLRSVGDSGQDLDGDDSGAVGGGATNDMSDSQRSLSEGRLLDVDGGYTRETLSQSHDSVFSESATASNLSIVLKAELTDVLRKRRNRPDASDEDLGLPRSPVSPQRLAGAGQSRKSTSYQTRSVTQGHEVSSLSLLSVNSTDGIEDTTQSHRSQHTSNKSISSTEHMGSLVLRNHQHEDDVDAVGSERQRLSHAAARHKMAIRPVKKKVPTRQHRRTLDTSIPEVNEELAKQAQNPILRTLKDTDLNTKTRSLPPGSTLTAATTATATTNSTVTNLRTKTIEQNNSTRTTTTTPTSSSSSQVFGLRALTFKAANALFDGRYGESSTDGDDVTNGTSDSSEHGFLRRLIHRNSKRSIARANDGFEDVDNSQNSAKKLQISTSCLEATSRDPLQLSSKSRSATSHEQYIQETRQTIKREIQNEGKHGLNAMVSNYGVQPQPPTAVKPKSGPAARQRYLPQELGVTSPSASLTNSDSDVTNLLSRSSRGNDTFQSTSLVREQTQLKSESSSSSGHFERKPRIVGLSAFQQKLSRSSDSMGQHSSSSNSLETSTDEPSPLYYEEKQRKTVEKARSFRNYQVERDVIIESPSMHSNMPSLPDLSLSFRVPTSYYKQQQSPQSPSPLTSPMSPNAKCVSLGFEINDNKLLQSRTESTGKLQQTKLSPQRNSALLLTTPGPANISQIEQNIDLIVKSPMVSLLRNSGTVSEQLTLEPQQPAVPLRPKVLELKQTTTIAIGSPGKEVASPLAKNAKLSSSPPTTPCKTNAEIKPEFMKIQLNRVDQARLHSKTNHLVLAKNVKTPSTPSERSQSSDDLSIQRLSNESPKSVHIVERCQKPAQQTLPNQHFSQPTVGGSLVKQKRAVSANSLRSSYVSSGSSSNGSSEVLITSSPAATAPSTPPKIKPLEHNVEQEKANAKRFSLEERKRLFLSEEKTQAERKLAEMRYERKKPINEELQKKSESVTPSSPITPSSPEVGNGNAVVLRKKSFGSTNGSTNSSCNGNGSGSCNTSGNDDPTPELMKVFARRSLKVKDEDVVAMAQVVMAANHKKITNGSQSIDSDKENQSNSEEKLDKIQPIQEPPKATQTHATHPQQSVANNRSTVADFRNLNNNVQPAAQQKFSNLPPIKISNVRNSNGNSNKSNSNNNNNSVKHPNERYSLQLKSMGATINATTPTAATAKVVTASTTVDNTTAAIERPATPTKPIERSATVGEFKGIHQRRAEWEQRVKEALK